MASNIKKVKLKYLTGISNSKYDKTYKWDTLKESLKNNGHDIKKYHSITVTNFYKQYYLVMDGHHRVTVLKELYGEDYEIDVEVKNFLESFIPLFFFPIVLTTIIIYKFISIFIKYHSDKLIK
jgi:hypothetical protein